jgi:uncharacterized protein YraI
MKSILFAVPVVILFASTVACSSVPDDADGDSADEALTGAGDFREGERLTTTSRLNLREGPSLSAPVLTIIPRGAIVTVTPPDEGNSPNPTGDYFHLDYQGTSGWAHGGYLSAESDPGVGRDAGSNTGAGAACMTKIARAATSRDGYGSGGKCYHYVKEHIGAALGIGFEGVQQMVGDGYQLNAADFARWIRDDPGGRASRSGFVRSNASLNALPLGAILVWQPGQCGYSSSAGHIEVNIGNGRACSDFCGHIKTTCGAPTVVVYQKGC